MTPPPQKVILVDDHAIVALGIQTLLRDSEEFVLAGVATHDDAALRELSDQQPDLAILDLLLPGRGGLEIVAEARKVSPHTKILIYSSLPELTYAPRALRAGVQGYVCKEAGLGVLLDGLRFVSEGGIYATHAVKQLILENYGRIKSSKYEGVGQLSNQELNVFRLIGAGLRLSEIAEKLGISPKTVGTHRERIKSKLSLRSGKELDKEAHKLSQVTSI